MTVDNWFEQLFLGNVTPAPFDHTAEKVRADAKAGLYDEKSEINDPMRLILEPATLNTGKIGDISIPEVKKFEFRPTKWEEFIGQEDAKELAKTIIIPQF